MINSSKKEVNENEFIKAAEEKLISIFDRIDEIDKKSIFDCEYSDGILTIKSFANNKEYVINKHFASRKIWFSSPISGADYFSYAESEQKWLNDKKQELSDIFFSEIKSHFNIN